MKIKPGRRGASIAGIKPEAVVGMMVAKSVFNEWQQPFQISSGLEGRHGRNSLHFVGLAFEIDQDQWHIEFQPERRLP